MKKVMFVCRRNSCRSQMAEGWAKTLGENKIKVDLFWIRSQSSNRWILLMGDVPQLRLYTEEAIAFLETRRLENS